MKVFWLYLIVGLTFLTTATTSNNKFRECEDMIGAYTLNFMVNLTRNGTVYLKQTSNGKISLLITGHLNITKNGCQGVGNYGEKNIYTLTFNYRLSSSIIYVFRDDFSTPILLRKINHTGKGILSTEPRLEFSKNKNGVIIRGCMYEHYERLNVYWIFNGKITGTGNQPNDEDIVREQEVESTDGKLKLFAIPSLPIKYFSAIGTYQCVVLIPVLRLNESKELVVTAAELEPTFTQNLELIYNNENENVLVYGCLIHSVLSLSNESAYYQQNHGGNISKRVNVNLTRKHGNDSLWEFPNIVFPGNLGNLSSYQCKLYVKDLDMEIMSESVPLYYADEMKIFKSGPNKTGKSLIINGCKYGNYGNIGQIFTYWMFNGERMENSKTLSGNITVEKRNGENISFTPTYTIGSYAEIGIYQCMLLIERFNLTFVSEESFVVDIYNLPEPTFMENLTLIYNNKNENVLVYGCLIHSVLSLSNENAYYQENHGSNLSTRVNVSLARKHGNNSLWEFPSIVFPGSLGNLSSYQCKLYVEDVAVEIISEAVPLDYADEMKIFKSGPNKIGTSLIINGCKYRNHGNIGQIFTYWMFNGERIENSKTLSGNITVEGRDIESISFTKSYTIGSYAEIGIYQCMLFIERSNLTFVSDEFFVVDINNLPDIKFVKGPEVSSHKETGGNVSVGKCVVQSELPLESKYMFYIKDGFQVISVQTEPTSNNKLWMFPSLNLTNTTFKDQGFYQCMVFIDEKEFYSTDVNIQFEDVSAVKINMRLKGDKFREEYHNRSSEHFKTLEDRVIKVVAKEARKLKWISVDNNANIRDFIKVLGFRDGSVIADILLTLPKQNETSKANRCKGQTGISSGNGNIELEVSFLDCCTPIFEGSDEYKGRYEYKTTVVGSFYTQDCKYQKPKETVEQPMKRFCKGSLKSKPYWEKQNLEGCGAKSEVTNELIELEGLSTDEICNQTSSNINSNTNSSNNCTTILEVSAKLAKIVGSSSGNEAIPEDISIVSSIVTLIVNRTDFKKIDIETGTKLTDNVLGVVDNLLKINETIMQNSEKKEKGKTPVADLLKNLDNLANGVGSIIKGTNRSINISKSNLAFEIVSINPSEFTVVASEESKYAVIQTTVETPDSETLENAVASFRAENITLNNTDSLVYSYFFTKPNLFTENRNATNSINTVVGSNILAVTIVELGNTSLKTPVNLTFNKREVDQNIRVIENKCSFWNVSSARWEGTGCMFLREDEKTVTCQCYHLTNFAMLFDVSQKQHNPLSLQIITWIGCGVSLTGLFLTLLTYLKFRHLLRKLPAKLLMFLTLSMIFLLVTFLFGVNKPLPRMRCQIFAALIQYFILTTFSWMGVEAFNMYKSFVKVFGSSGQRQKIFLIWSSLISWGGSGVVVVVTGFAAPQNLGNENFCVVMGYSFYFGVLLPIGMILLFNIIILGFVLKALNARTVATARQVDNKTQILRQTKITLACSMLLGLTWVFGLFAVGEAAETFQWLFTIFNSLQGFFIFVFYTLTSPEIQKEWKQALPKHLISVHSGSLSPSTSRNTTTSRLNKKSKSLDDSVDHSIGNSVGNHYVQLNDQRICNAINREDVTTKL